MAKIILPTQTHSLCLQTKTKQQLIDTITNKKVQDVSTLSRITTAGTGCGGCWCELESLLNLTDAN